MSGPRVGPGDHVIVTRQAVQSGHLEPWEGVVTRLFGVDLLVVRVENFRPSDIGSVSGARVLDWEPAPAPADPPHASPIVMQGLDDDPAHAEEPRKTHITNEQLAAGQAWADRVRHSFGWDKDDAPAPADPQDSTT